MSKSKEKKGGGIVTDSLFPDVTFLKIMTVIIKTIMKLAVIIIAILTFVFNAIFWTIVVILIVCFTILGSMIIPGILALCIYFAVSRFWDNGARPTLSIVQEGINFVVGLWNSVVRALRKFGVRLDTADGFGTAIPTFWEFIKFILYNAVLKPIEAGLKGVIFR
jgi:hypothetical protein